MYSDTRSIVRILVFFVLLGIVKMATVLAEPLPHNPHPPSKDLLPNGGDSQKPSRQSTLKSSGSQESRNGGPRLRLMVPEERARPSITSEGSGGHGRMNFDKLRRLSRAYDLASKLYFFLFFFLLLIIRKNNLKRGNKMQPINNRS